MANEKVISIVWVLTRERHGGEVPDDFVPWDSRFMKTEEDAYDTAISMGGGFYVVAIVGRSIRRFGVSEYVEGANSE